MRGVGCVDTVEDELIAHEVQLAKLRHLRQLRNILIWFFLSIVSGPIENKKKLFLFTLLSSVEQGVVIMGRIGCYAWELE